MARNTQLFGLLILLTSSGRAPTLRRVLVSLMTRGYGAWSKSTRHCLYTPYGLRRETRNPNFLDNPLPSQCSPVGSEPHSVLRVRSGQIAIPLKALGNGTET